MKTEYWILLAIGGYWLYSKSQGANVPPMTYPPYQGGPYVPGSSRATGSGGTTASIPGGGGTSVTNPPVGGMPGSPSWSPNPTGVNNPGSGYVQCLDGSYANDASQCPENMPSYTCSDGTVVNDPTLCPESQPYWGYTCADGTQVNDPSLCPEAQGL
jgi:hypothetical protein